MRTTRIGLLVVLCLVASTEVARGQEHDWKIAVYPILAWVPVDIGIDVEIPPFDNDDGGAGDILDSRFDGAFLGGFAASNGTWRIEGYGIWAGFGGDRPERPFLTVDVDVIYAHALVGRRLAPDLYVTGGLRRVSLEYDITLGSLPQFSRKPGIWDPLVGIGWHRIGEKVEWHASFDGGGFGAGADVDLSAQARVDWKPIPHFGFTAGYNILYLKVSDEVRNRPITIKPTLHGPLVGIGLYF